MRKKKRKVTISRQIFWQLLIGSALTVIITSFLVFALSFYPYYQQKKISTNQYYDKILTSYTNQIQLSLLESRSISLQISSQTRASILLGEIESSYQRGQTIAETLNIVC